MKTLFIIAALSTMSMTAFAQSFQESQNCVIVYAKKVTNQPNMIIACDGTMSLQHVVRTEDQLENPAEFKQGLFNGFQQLVNADGKKRCQQFEAGAIWYATCNE